MCKCTPEIRTPFCGKLGCGMPEQKAKTPKSSIQETIAKLDEMREQTTPGHWHTGNDREESIGIYADKIQVAYLSWWSTPPKFDEDAKFIVNLVNEYENLRRAALAGEELSKEMMMVQAHIGPGSPEKDYKDLAKSACNYINQAISTYRSAVGIDTIKVK